MCELENKFLKVYWVCFNMVSWTSQGKALFFRG